MRTHWQALPFLVLPGLALLAPGFVPDLEWTTLSGASRELALRPRLLELALAGWLPAEAFARRGITVVDTDQIARQVVAPETPGLAALVDEFGPAILDAEGHLDRSRLRQRVFEDAAARRRLEQLLHPLIRDEALRQARAATSPYVVLVVPLLLESGMDALVDRILVVDLPEAEQLRRLRSRDSMDQAMAEAMIAAQTSRARRLAAADDVIENSGSLEALDQAVGALHRHYLELAEGASP